jgi:indolepyruvate ferredoxin oxidoreductase, alpha subunit
MSEYDFLISDHSEEKRLFLLGNEAIARGVIEAGASIATTYPGTPSSEVGDALSAIARRAGLYFEDSTNEIVALEVASAASVSGLRAFVFMKHVGLNVASDALMSTSYLGTKGGLVIMTADDPSMFSSQNEQDNRHYAEMGNIPLVEPSNPQEAKDFVLYAFDLSELFGGPVLFRTTTRVSHMRGLVNFGPRRRIMTKGMFKKDPTNLVILPSVAYKKKAELLERFNRISEIAEESPLNRIEKYRGGGDVGIITSGAAYNSTMDALENLDLKVDILKLGFPNPLPEKLVSRFLKSHTRTIVIEELDPINEERIRVVAQLKGISTQINGKMDRYFPLKYEYSPDIVADSLSRILGLELKEKTSTMITDDVKFPNRLPVMCPGCPHRATVYAMELVSKQLGLKNAIYATDIGCYSLGVQKPYNEGDYLLCMGSSVGTAAGFSKSTDQPVIAFIGDSTFFHAGIPGLVNAVHNNHKFMLVVMDNETTAMTGNQPNPGVPLNGMLEESPEISIEEVVKASGVKFVRTIDPLDVRSTMSSLKDALHFDGVSVIIAKAECALIKDDKKKLKGEHTISYRVNQEKCSLCMNCIKNFSCPAFYLEGKHVLIDPALCDGCGVCVQPLVCGPRAIEARR